MKLFDSIRAFWLRGTRSFNSYEMNVLNAVMNCLDTQRAERLRRRINVINLVQRHDEGREIDAYHMKGGRPNLDHAMRINEEKGEQVLAKFSGTTVRGRCSRGKSGWWTAFCFHWSSTRKLSKYWIRN